MSRMPGFTAEAALFERAQRRHDTVGVSGSSGSVKPAFRFQTVSRLSSIERLLCCLRCGPGEACVYSPGVCACISEVGPSNGRGTPSPVAVPLV